MGADAAEAWVFPTGSAALVCVYKFQKKMIGRNKFFEILRL